MRNYLRFYIDGEWVGPDGSGVIEVINPASECVAGTIAMGQGSDIDKAVQAARKAFTTWGFSSREDRLDVLCKVAAEYENRYNDMVEAITEEMGAPLKLSRDVQAAMGREHIKTAIEVLKSYAFENLRGKTNVVKEAIGVCGFITPWNWPVNQIASKVAPALATGCTMVLKPSEVAPFSGQIWTEIMDAAGVPAGVYNMVNGDGPVTGAALSGHPDVDMISFTGSTRAGVEVAKNAAPTVKRVHQELGGKSPYIILPDADVEKAVGQCVHSVIFNSGQNCNAPTRLLVPHKMMDDVAELARKKAETYSIGDPNGDADVGPVVSEVQRNKIQGLIEKGIEEGARLVTGGCGRPKGLERGYFVKPTVFSYATNEMSIAREEIFGPVVVIIGYSDVNEAIKIGNDTEYGLASYISGNDLEQIKYVASRLRTGQVNINGAAPDLMAPFGGYKKSGNGREWGDFAFEEFLEVKAILGYTEA